jgi:hypothetical protein|tara:strand:- start:10 stop:1422 length:1413 start_codon:yes stop_codon:yes gene_type:complete
MGIKIKHTDPTLNSFSSKDLVINVQSGSLFYKSNTKLFKIQGDDLSTSSTEGSILGGSIIFDSTIAGATTGLAARQNAALTISQSQGSGFGQLSFDGNEIHQMGDSLFISQLSGDTRNPSNQSGIFFRTGVTSLPTRMFMSSSGVIGIATSTPSLGNDETYNPVKLVVDGMISSSHGFEVSSQLATENLAVGWYTVAVVPYGRATGRFSIEDRESNRHQTTVFYASQLYGSNQDRSHIRVIDSNRYNTHTVEKIRIKSDRWDDGAALQIYVKNSTNALRFRFLGDDIQSQGWIIKNFVPDATDPGNLNQGQTLWANFSVLQEFDLGDGRLTGTTGNVKINGDLEVIGTVSKGGGSFKIDHPDPTKTNTHHLYHNFVESPTEGDNIYRWTIITTNKTHTIILPDYYKFLNKNDMVWVNAVNHFGRAYGVLNKEQTELTITSDIDGRYNVLLIGTRKDQFTKDNYKGVEVLK